VEKVKAGVQEELDTILPGGVEIMAMMLDRFEFARLGPSGEVDRSYQEKLNEVLRLVEDSERERLRIKTVKAEGERREFETQAHVNRLVQEALGAKSQAETRGGSYLTSRENEAKSVLAVGKAEVQGLIERINALEGPGGAAILKLELANALRQSDPRFVLMGSGGTEKGIDVQRTDTNELINQLGVFEALSAKTGTAASAAVSGTASGASARPGSRIGEIAKPEVRSGGQLPSPQENQVASGQAGK
jgi:hypothetical protein